MSIEKGWEAIRRMQAVSDEEVASMNTKAVARYRTTLSHGLIDTQEHPVGPLIFFADHERVVGELAHEVKGLSQSLTETFKSEEELRSALAASRAEVEGLKKDAERRLDLIRATVENSEWRHSARNIYGELRREIQSADAAMEKENV